MPLQHDLSCLATFRVMSFLVTSYSKNDILILLLKD